MLKKFFVGIMAVAAMLTVTGTMTSCKPVQAGTIMYCVETNDGDFFDNMDVLKNAIEDSFVPGGMQQASDHYYVLEGEVNACNKKATTIFQNRCKAIDKDRSQLSLPLAIKGVTVKLMYTYGGSKDTQLSTYTFKENDPE